MPIFVYYSDDPFDRKHEKFTQKHLITFKEREFGRSGGKWEDNIKMDLEEIGCDGVDRIHLANNRGQWGVLVNTAMHLRIV
jgi:hypothetical protein